MLSMGFIGGAEGIRTPDPLTARPATPFNAAPGQARKAHNNSVRTGILFIDADLPKSV